MSEGMFSAVMLGALVDGNTAERFRKAVEPLSTEEAIKVFVRSVINGDLKIVNGGGVDEQSI